MAWPKGIPNPNAPKGGRPPGTKNKVSKTLVDALAEHSFDPLAHILKVLPTCAPEAQAEICVKLLPYIYVRKENNHVSVWNILFRLGYKSLEELPEEILDQEIERLLSTGRSGAPETRSLGSGSTLEGKAEVPPEENPK